MSRIIRPFESTRDKVTRLRDELRAEGAEQRVRYCKTCKRLAHRPDFWINVDDLITQTSIQSEMSAKRQYQTFQRWLCCDQCGNPTGPLTGEGFISIYRLAGFDGLIKALNDHYRKDPLADR